MGDRRRDEEFTDFVLATAPRLHRAALLLAGQPHLAEDLLQTAYTRLFVAWPRVQRAGNPVAYAYTTLTHVFLSHHRARGNSELPVAQLPESLADLGGDIALQQDLLKALRRLPTLDRTILVLRYCEDRSVAETAAEVGLSPIAVRSRASRALARIRPLLTIHLDQESR